MKKSKKFLGEIKMNNFPDFFKEHNEEELKLVEKMQEARLKLAKLQPELIFELYFNLLCDFQSNFDFCKFLDDLYQDVVYRAKSCIKIGMDINQVAEEDVETWFRDMLKCLKFLLTRVLLNADSEDYQKFSIIRPEGGFASDLRIISKNIKVIGNGEWEWIGIKLNELINNRVEFEHEADFYLNNEKKLIRVKKKSQHEIRERARNHKKDYVEIHTESLKNIKNDFPSYEREKEV